MRMLGIPGLFFLARPDSAPIWGGKKVEFRYWTKRNPEMFANIAKIANLK